MTIPKNIRPAIGEYHRRTVDMLNASMLSEASRLKASVAMGLAARSLLIADSVDNVVGYENALLVALDRLEDARDLLAGCDESEGEGDHVH